MFGEEQKERRFYYEIEFQREFLGKGRLLRFFKEIWVQVIFLLLKNGIFFFLNEDGVIGIIEIYISWLCFYVSF